MPAHDEDDGVLPLEPGPLVLVVDDELTPRSLVTRMVRSLGYPVRSCPAGRDALRFMQDHPREVRLLLADLAMPGMDGGELVERARDLDPGLRVVLLVGQEEHGVAELLPGYRDLPIVEKPVAFGRLAELLEHDLGAPRRPPGPPHLRSARERARRSSGQHRV
jgi:two-component system cell cycle sensor histidine kinase/response regulator CckA